MLPSTSKTAAKRRNGVQPLRERTVLRGSKESDGHREQDGPQDHDAQIFGETAAKTPRALDSPYQVEARFDFLNRGDHGVHEKYQSDRAEQFAAHVRDELHHGLGQLRSRVAHGAEEFVNDEPQVAPRADALEYRKAEHHQRHERQQSGVGQAHRPNADLTAQPVADQRRRVAQPAQCRPPGRPHAARLLKQSVFQAFQPAVHGGDFTRSGAGAPLDSCRWCASRHPPADAVPAASCSSAGIPSNRARIACRNSAG